MNSSKFKVDSELNQVEVQPVDIIQFEYQLSKRIQSRIWIKNNTDTDKKYRILTTQPTQYKIQYSGGDIIGFETVVVSIQLLCEESRLEHRLKDKFKVQVMEKAKYDIVFDSSEKWKELILDRELQIGIIRSDPQQVATLLQSQLRMSYTKKSSYQINDSLINQEEALKLRKKLDHLKRKYDDQRNLIDQYKFDINELQNEIDRNSFIYDSEQIQNKQIESQNNLILALRDKTGIPLWELFIAASIAVILGAILN